MNIKYDLSTRSNLPNPPRLHLCNITKSSLWYSLIQEDLTSTKRGYTEYILAGARPFWCTQTLGMASMKLLEFPYLVIRRAGRSDSETWFHEGNAEAKRGKVVTMLDKICGSFHVCKLGGAG